MSDTSRQFDEWCEEPGERDSHKAVPIAVTPHRLIAAEVPLELSLSKRLLYQWLLYQYLPLSKPTRIVGVEATTGRATARLHNGLKDG